MVTTLPTTTPHTEGLIHCGIGVPLRPQKRRPLLRRENCSARLCTDERVCPAARQARSRAHSELGQLPERSDGCRGLLQTQAGVNREATHAERSTRVVAKEPLGRHFGKPIVDHDPTASLVRAAAIRPVVSRFPCCMLATLVG